MKAKLKRLEKELEQFTKSGNDKEVKRLKSEIKRTRSDIYFLDKMHEYNLARNAVYQFS